MYPLIWINWDYIRDCYHGQAMVTGLLANQKFINKMFALVGISLLTTAFPKVIYDKNRIRSWDGSVGSAVGVNGNVDNVAKTIDGAIRISFGRDNTPEDVDALKDALLYAIENL